MKSCKLFAKLKIIFWYHLNVYRFKRIGKYSYINSPLRIQGRKNIIIGKGVTVGYKSWLAAKPIIADQNAELVIDDGAVIGNYNHIYSTLNIEIEKNVLTADKVYISDCSHIFADPNKPIMYQGVKQLNPVKIGNGSWIGENVCIIGASIGKNSVVGANSVVLKNIPDYCIAVGSPAVIVKRFNFDSGKWERTKPNGEFINKAMIT